MSNVQSNLAIKDKIIANKKKAEWLKDKIETIFNLNDLSILSRKRELVYVKTIYLVIGHDKLNIPKLNLIEVIGKTTGTAAKLYKNHSLDINSKTSIYNYMYNDALNKLNLNTVDVLSENPIINRIAKELKTLPDNLLIDLEENRINPFIKINKNVITNKDLIKKQKLTRTM